MTTLAQRSFAGGEIAPALYGRIDQAKYGNGLRTMRNFLVMRHGGGLSRPGTTFVAEVKDSTKAVGFIPFVFNSAQTYNLEFGDQYMRVHRDGAQVVETALVLLTAISNPAGGSEANRIIVNGVHGYTDGQEVAISGVNGTIGDLINGRNFKVRGTSASTFVLQYTDGSGDVVASGLSSTLTGSEIVARVYTIATPYLEAHLPDLRFVQSADVITIVHPSYDVRELSRTGHTSWTLALSTFAPTQVGPTNIAFASGGAGAIVHRYRVTAVASETSEESLVGTYLARTITGATQANPCVITAVAHGFANGDEVLISGVVGMTQLNGNTYTVAGVTANTFQLSGVDSTAYTAYSSGGTAVRTGIIAAAPTTGAPHTVSWTAAAGAQEYNIYKAVNGVYGFLGTAVGTSFSDVGVAADVSDTPPDARNPFSGAGNFPSAVAYTQQRLVLANTDNDPDKAWASRTSSFKNFTVSRPSQDDDAVTFTLTGREVNEVEHLLEVGKLLVFTSGGEVSINGDANGALRPGEVNPRHHSYNGSGRLRPLVVGGNALYVQARGAVVRDLGFDYQIDGYRGNDLSIFSAHLFEGYTLSDWTYQQIPHSIVWSVRSDGTLLGMTYVREHQLVAWHHHDFDGIVEKVCAIPEGDEDALYLLIKRTINGASKRYIERMVTRKIDDIRDFIGLDCALTYDGRNANGAHTMTLSGSGWTYTDTLTLTSSAAFFTSSDVGNEIHLTGSDGTLIRAEITAFTSSTVVSVKPHKTVPVAMQAAAISDWGRAVDEVSGLWHLEAKQVGVFADGHVAASPNNEAYTVITVASGKATLDKPYVVIHVGLPFICDIETLDVDLPQSETLVDKKKLIGEVSLYVEKSRGIWIGPKPPTDDDDDPLEGLIEMKIRGEAEEGYDDPVALATGVVNVKILPEWNSNGRVFIRQIDPVPLSVLAIAPAGYIPIRG